jgi:superfamily II DNA or RNA helicase
MMYRRWVAIILATSSNMNQIVQRIGRTLRKTAGKDTALIYTIYLSHTHDFGTLKMVRQATKVEDENNGPKVADSNLDRYVL